jgi:hypothetical protein
MADKKRMKRRQQERESERASIEQEGLATELAKWTAKQLHNVSKHVIVWFKSNTETRAEYLKVAARDAEFSRDLYNRLNTLMMWWELLEPALIRRKLGIQDEELAYIQCRELWEALGLIHKDYVTEMTRSFRKSDIENMQPEFRRNVYTGYLESPQWERTRNIALKRANHKCQICGSASRLQVHHNTYDRVYQELPTDLIVLCHSCHDLFHKNGKLAKIEDF